MQLQEEVDEDDVGEDGEEPEVIEGYPLLVTIGLHKGGKQLTFNCLAAHELVIDSIRMVRFVVHSTVSLRCFA